MRRCAAEAARAHKNPAFTASTDVRVWLDELSLEEMSCGWNSPNKNKSVGREDSGTARVRCGQRRHMGPCGLGRRLLHDAERRTSSACQVRWRTTWHPHPEAAGVASHQRRARVRRPHRTSDPLASPRDRRASAGAGRARPRILQPVNPQCITLGHAVTYRQCTKLQNQIFGA